MVIYLRIFVKDTLNNACSFQMLVEKCPGDCITDRIAEYCEAYYKSPKLCGSGKKCCVTKDSEYSADEIIVPLAYGANSTKGGQDRLERVPTADPPKNNKPKPSKKVVTTTTTTPAPEPGQKACRGRCVSGLFALLCDDIDTNAFCPGDGNCCIDNDSSNEGTNDIEERVTTPAPIRTKPTTKATKVRLTSRYIILCL